MNKLLFLLFCLLFIASCNSSSARKDLPSVQEAIVAIEVPFEEHGYHNFNTLIISTDDDFSTFIADVKNQIHWNNKEAFLQKLQTQDINFAQYNVLLYRLTEPSISNKLTVNPPKYDSDNNLSVFIQRDIPETGDSAMAYYTLAYKIEKKASQVIFDNGKQKAIIENMAGTNLVPKNCLTWFDGCNDCKRHEATGEAICTEMSCTVRDEFNCKKWAQ